MDKVAENDPKALLGGRQYHCHEPSLTDIRQDSWQLDTGETQPSNFRNVRPSVPTPPESPRMCVDLQTCDRSLERQVQTLHGAEGEMVQRNVQCPATNNGPSTVDRRVNLGDEAAIGREGNTQAVETGTQRRAIEPTANIALKPDHRQQETIDADWEVDVDRDGAILFCQEEYTNDSPSQGSSFTSDDLYTSPEDDIGFSMIQNQCTSSGAVEPVLSCRKPKDTARSSSHSDLSSSAKRRRESDDQSDQDDLSVHKRPRRQESDDAETPLFACPFFKKDRQKYQKCLHYQLRRIKDVKQHLKRQHCQPDFYCARCYTIFESANSRDKHARSQRCEVICAPGFDGVSVEQMKKLNQQYVSRGKSTTEQWYDMWDILFPSAPPPSSVYVSNCVEEVIQILRSNWETRSGEIIAEVAESNSLNIDSQLVSQLFPLILDNLAKGSGSATEYYLPKTFATLPDISVPSSLYETVWNQDGTGAFPMNDMTSDSFPSSSAKLGKAVDCDFSGIEELDFPKIVGDSSHAGDIGQAALDLDFISWENDDTTWDFAFEGER